MDQEKLLAIYVDTTECDIDTVWEYFYQFYENQDLLFFEEYKGMSKFIACFETGKILYTEYNTSSPTSRNIVFNRNSVSNICEYSYKDTIIFTKEDNEIVLNHDYCIDYKTYRRKSLIEDITN